jgi:hypothetical protein
MTRLARFALAPIPLLLLVGASCGGGDDSTETASPPNSNATATEASAATETTGGDGGEETDGPSSGFQEYFAAMEQVAITTDTRLEEIGAELNDATYSSDAEEIAANADGIQQSGEAIESALLNMSRLDPPGEVEDAHNDFADALDTVLQLFAAMALDIDDVSTSAQLNALTNQYSSDFSDADADFDDACLTLQGIADDSGINVDLRCTD